MKTSENKKQSTFFQYISQIQELNLQGKALGATQGKSLNSEDQVQAPNEGKETEKIYDALQKTPDLRMEKVEALHKEISHSQYDRDPAKVADKMVQQILMDSEK